jgi:hypothetical protein
MARHIHHNLPFQNLRPALALITEPRDSQQGTDRYSGADVEGPKKCDLRYIQTQRIGDVK